MTNKDLKCFKERLDSIDWDSDFEKADKENYEVLDSLCECIESEFRGNKSQEMISKALILLAGNVGCAEDFERYEENFIDNLVKEDLLTKDRLNLFYNNVKRRQG
nr:hypothetical protein [uncultured Lachnoanaerobaculum sp.]